MIASTPGSCAVAATVAGLASAAGLLPVATGRGPVDRSTGIGVTAAFGAVGAVLGLSELQRLRTPVAAFVSGGVATFPSRGSWAIAGGGLGVMLGAGTAIAGALLLPAVG